MRPLNKVLLIWSIGFALRPITSFEGEELVSYLDSGKWLEVTQAEILSLKFDAKGTLRIDNNGIQIATGKYNLKKATISFRDISFSSPANSILTERLHRIANEKQCEMIYTGLALKYDREINCSNGLKLFNLPDYPEARSGIVESVSLSKFPLQKVVVIESVRIREKPEINGPLITCKLLIDKKSEVKKSLPKGFNRLKLIARTTAQSKVGKFSNYWYYVAIDVLDSSNELCEAHFGWIFGEFIRY